MNLIEFIFAFSAVFGSTLAHYFWTRFVYKIENSESTDLRESETINTQIDTLFYVGGTGQSRWWVSLTSSKSSRGCVSVVEVLTLQAVSRQRSWELYRIFWTLSSVGQSIRLIIGRSKVQVLEGPLFYFRDRTLFSQIIIKAIQTLCWRNKK